MLPYASFCPPGHEPHTEGTRNHNAQRQPDLPFQEEARRKDCADTSPEDCPKAEIDPEVEVVLARSVLRHDRSLLTTPNVEVTGDGRLYGRRPS